MNRLKQAFAEKRPAVGLWQSLANSYTAEICAAAGFDWLMLDTEHSPNTLQMLLAQLQAVAAYPVEPVVRPPSGDAVVIKQYLDLGVRSLLVPMVNSADEARQIVAATRYPPQGIRGVAISTTRASRFGMIPNYAAEAHKDQCVIVQIESRAALGQIEAIAAVEGVDALFVGPGDLAASLGHLGNPAHPDVRAAIQDALARIIVAGKPAGVLASDPEQAKDYFATGVAFASVGTDVGLVSRGARDLAARARA